MTRQGCRLRLNALRLLRVHQIRGVGDVNSWGLRRGIRFKMYQEAVMDIVVLVGSEYESGISQDWATKGPTLQMVKGDSEEFFLFADILEPIRIVLGSSSQAFVRRRLVVSIRGDDPCKELEILKTVYATVIIHGLRYIEEQTGRVHAAGRLSEYPSKNSLIFLFPNRVPRDDLIIGVGANDGARLVDELEDRNVLSPLEMSEEGWNSTMRTNLTGIWS
ncbi:(E)-4-hydroxy-3-methylbut-2-enyl diphosphate synthase [Artemisia annua]|uniref:(E)-4-hydroxy-3-methylbut-2-enyl diphosphate synthase n=1 Tax=Artemisia annua TaxID=35608 RepID=A0A2U1P4S4_ARTAN|nr:(E)-4-hydroxy-3-methylbut-2-enyl diphosphate synthase [Artemisia annua]